MLSVSPKQDLNSLKNSLEVFSTRDSLSNNGANDAKAELLNNVPPKPTRDASVGYLYDYLYLIKEDVNILFSYNF